MKKSLLMTLGIVLLAAPLMAAASPAAAGSADRAFLASLSEPGCNAGSTEEISNRPPEIGLEIPKATPMQLAICPTPTACPAGCAASLSGCTTASLGQCCAIPGGGQLCCTQPTGFIVHTCPCVGAAGCAAFKAVSVTC